jgi:mycoredoxin
VVGRASADTTRARRSRAARRPGCSYCLKLRAKLTLTRTPHRLVNIWEDVSAARTVREVNGGNELVPTVQVGDRFLSNPTVRQIRQAQDAPGS